MKIFHCDHCDHLVFFESVRCVRCERLLAFLPDLEVMASRDPQEFGAWTSPMPGAAGRRYRLCKNYTQHDICNWAVSAEDNHACCLACRLTRVIPNLFVAGNKEAWFRLEVAKRRLVYTLLHLRLPLKGKEEDAKHGLAFEFLADSLGGPAAPTGHAQGVITVNIAEADDVERERRRKQMGEPYRTLLGHFRHEIGHYYWDRLIKDGLFLNRFRELFGDERADYGAALKRHYAQGAPPDWMDRFVSAYSSAHPWEDWAETWAHYLHMADALETAAACGLSLTPKRAGEPSFKPIPQTSDPRRDFANIIQNWHGLTYALSNLNRGLGLPDGYPFVLSGKAVDKLSLIHDVVMSQS